MRRFGRAILIAVTGSVLLAMFGGCHHDHDHDHWHDDHYYHDHDHG